MKHIKGSALEDGIHHDHHHDSCSRREFLSRLGLMAAGGAFMLNSTPVQALGSSSLFRRLAQLETDKVLVLIQLGGGNDGLNTVVPIENDDYYNLRPTIGIPKNDTFRLNDTLGLHPSMTPLEGLWNEGRMGVIQNVGYPEPNLSHFRSTDIWLTASDSDEELNTGWAGRYFEGEFPDFNDNPTDFPLAVQIGGTSSLLFRGSNGNMGLTVGNINLLERLIERGVLYDTDNLPPTIYGSEMNFVRTIANSSNRYAVAIKDAHDSVNDNADDYGGGQLGRSLSIVSRLIKGDLGSRIYLVSLPGFDTHGFQLDRHSNLLRLLSESIRDFYNDLSNDGRSGDVLTMTFSEFGRRVFQNNSQGTDHGTAAPVFIFGDNVNGGVYGTDPKLAEEDLDESFNLQYETDFRQVYTTILNEWFELDDAITADALGGEFEKIPFIEGVSVSNEPEQTPLTFRLDQNYPNPFNPTTNISFNLPEAGTVRLEVFDIQGRRVSMLADRRFGAGNHVVTFDARNLSSGVYIYKLRAGNFAQSKTMTLIK